MPRLLPLVLVLALGLPALAQPAERATPVTTAPVVSAEVAEGRTFVGSVVASRESLVSTEFGGLVVEYLVDAGQRVEQGDPLVRLRTTILQKQIEAAKAEERLREKEVEELENGSRPEAIDEARARLDQVDVEVEKLQWELEATQRLYDSQRVSEDELRTARLDLESAKRRRAALKFVLDLLVKGPREESIDQARARKDAQLAEVERLEEMLERHTIRAPFSGYVVEERTEEGQWLGAGDPVVRMVALDEVDVLVPVLEDYVNGLPPGMEVQVEIPALPGLRPEQRVAKLHTIVPDADPRARTFPVRFRLPNVMTEGGPTIKAGMFARVTLAVGEPQPALLVPKDALVLGGPQPVVIVVDGESRAQPVPVTLGIAKDGMMQVFGGLQAGQMVVTRGNERLRPGMLVQPLDEGR